MSRKYEHRNGYLGSMKSWELCDYLELPLPYKKISTLCGVNNFCSDPEFVFSCYWYFWYPYIV